MHLKLYGRKHKVMQKVHYWIMENMDRLYERHAEDLIVPR